MTNQRIRRSSCAPSAARPHSEYYRLHIDNQGREHRWWRTVIPNQPSLWVEVVRAADGKKLEETRTVNVKSWCGAFCEITPVRPRGGGWALHDDTSDNFTAWRRPQDGVVR